MSELKLKWQLFPLHVIVLVFTMLAVAWYGTYSLKKFYVAQKASFLEAQSSLILSRVTELSEPDAIDKLDRFCRATGKKVSIRITVIEPEGRVVCDSDRDYRSMQNHANRPEIIMALLGKVGSSQRYSTTTRQEMLYVAIPIIKKGIITGVLRTSVPLTDIESELQRLFSGIAAGIIIVIVIASVVSLLLARKISQPLEQMKKQSIRFAQGDFKEKIRVAGSEEIVGLAQAMNSMATQLDERMEAVLRKSKELETVLSSMVEGVMAIDPSERVLYMNGSAQRQLDIEKSDVKGKKLLEIVRNIELLRFIEQTLSQEEQTERTIVFHLGKREERILQIHGAQLFDGAKNRIGALIVMNDVTRLLQLENLRRDFVANVSHELKTPITSVKGYVETLLDETEDLPQHVKDFLSVISRQTNRLHAIVEDLLSLAKIEEQSEREEIILQKGIINNVLQNAIEACSAKAADRNIRVSLECGDHAAMINGPLLEQAIINLLDNAIKYSQPGGEVHIDSSAGKESIVINIRDAGIGIARQNRERLFERFYVVDKGRSREYGGTGLGLAIVKHIVQAHGGRITVKSELEKGSIFSIHLPI